MRGTSIGSQVDHLEELAEELIKENPEETVIKAHMKAAGLRYTNDAVDRLTHVLNALDQARAVHSGPKERSHGKDL